MVHARRSAAARPVTTSMWCSTISTVLPSSACTERISSTSSGTFSTDTPAIGSSRRITRGVAGQHHRQLELALVAVRERGRRATAPAPREPDAARAPSAARSTAPRDARPRAARSASSPPSAASAASRTFSSTGSSGNTFETWNVRPSPARRAPERRLGRDVLAVQHDASARRPAQAGDRLKSVVLPAPFGPMTPRNSPARDLEPDIGDDRRAADVEPEIPGCEDRGALTRAMVVSALALHRHDRRRRLVRRRGAEHLRRPDACSSDERTRNIGCSIA